MTKNKLTFLFSRKCVLIRPLSKLIKVEMKTNTKEKVVAINVAISGKAHQALKHLCVSNSMTLGRMIEKLSLDAALKGVGDER